MRKEIKYELTYFKKGEELKKIIPIKFVSNRVYDLYADVAEKSNRLQILIEQQKKAIEDFAWISTDVSYTLKERREKTQPIKDELDKIIKEIKNLDNKAFVKERFNLIERILTDNGVTDSDLLNIDFWNDCVEPIEVWGFLSAAVTKDTNSKKKIPA